ncbi:MAG: hypothetical protein A2542_02815 [Parcubacteria group bacterium RIFOXYD2_FULL_52_8]|nr:MAG: hypothetical protein A2542_02815 [Parcubacteria group bacterium RIFOXYD2_FULL_52_8]
MQRDTQHRVAELFAADSLGELTLSDGTTLLYDEANSLLEMPPEELDPVLKKNSRERAELVALRERVATWHLDAHFKWWEQMDKAQREAKSIEFATAALNIVIALRRWGVPETQITPRVLRMEMFRG